MNGVSVAEPDHSEFVEVDPTGRYGRYDEILGKGASKTVYRGFDEYEGIEVAWNQVKLYDFLQSPKDLERLYCEIHLLKTLRHRNIMKFFNSWVDTANRNINFVTEMFTSGTLRQYRLKHRRVNIRAVKHWCRQILKGLVYLHGLEPPVIHRDLKCDNIFINGNQGEVKIGDLGLAAILRKSHADCCVGTPEFMAPEVYEEEYNELVDIYSFGMCVLEMVTFEYPYSECNHPAQIYKKVISGKKPEALYKVEDSEVRHFVEKCLATVSCRLTAKELLKDPFLQIDNYERPIDEFDEVGPLLRQPLLYGSHHSGSLLGNGYSNYHDYEAEYDLDYYPKEFEGNRIDDFTYEDEHPPDVAISIRGRREDDGIFLRLRITDKEGQVRNIFFPFDIETDTALSVATEMVAELDITDQDVTNIADMIDGEINNLVPGWKEETFEHARNYVSSNNHASANIDHHGCGEMHGRFEEFSDYHESPNNWDSSECDETAREMLDRLAIKNDEKIIRVDGLSESRSCSFSSVHHENGMRQEMRWIKAKYQMQLREMKDQELLGSGAPPWKSLPPKSFPSEKQENRCGNMVNNRYNNSEEVGSGSFSPDHRMATTAKSFYTSSLLPHPLHRASSLPVDAVDL